jgi:hypothetical protein
MAPWEKYQTQQSTAAPAGPWSKYAVPAKEGEDTEWSDLPGNILPSLGKLAGDTASALAPWNWDDIATNLYNAGFSGIADFYAQRYGSLENAKKTVINDPAGAVGDLTAFLTGGGAAAARLPGVAGKVGAAAQKMGKHIDPLMGTVPEQAVKKVGKAAAWAVPGVVGATTGAGKRAIDYAAGAGFESVGGNKKVAKDFRGHITGKMDPETSVFEARGSLASIKRDRRLEYQDGMRQILADRTPLPWTEIDRAIRSAVGIRKFKALSTSTKSSNIVGEMVKSVNLWKRYSRRDTDYRTMGGFDGLKKRLNEIRLNAKAGTPQRTAADTLYHGVRKAIVDASAGRTITGGTRGGKTYAEVMKAYDEATDLIDEITRTLSLGDTATVDTALRKLQSVMRDTAFTNYGARANLVQALIDNGSETLMHQLAGQALRPVLKSGPGAQFGLLMGGGAALSGVVNPKFLAILAMYSPRIMGETAYRAGQVGATIARPAMVTQRFLNNRGISYRGIGLAAQQAGKVSDAVEGAAQFKAALSEQAQKMGYNIHPSVIDRLARDIMSDDLAAVDRGIRTIGKNPRILKMIMDEGAQGDDSILHAGNG